MTPPCTRAIGVPNLTGRGISQKCGATPATPHEVSHTFRTPPWGHAPRMQTGGIRAQPPRAHATKQVGRRSHSSRRRSRRRLQNSQTERRPPTPPHAASRAPTRTSTGPPQRAAVPSPKSPPTRPARPPGRPDVRPSRSARRPGRRAHTPPGLAPIAHLKPRIVSTEISCRGSPRAADAAA